MRRRAKTRAFSMVELLASLSIIFVLIGFTYISGWPMTERFTDPRSEYMVSSEVNDAAEWLQGAVKRALWTGSDFKLMIPNGAPDSRIVISWPEPKGREKWHSERIAFQSAASANLFTFTSKFQTFTPACTIYVCYGDGKRERTPWVIIVSAEGGVRVDRI